MGVSEDLSSTLGIVAGAVFGGVSWFLNSPLFGVVAGVLLGTGLTMLTQSRTQKRIWRHELDLKNVDSIYAPLYQELNRILWKVQSFNAQSGYSALADEKWKTLSTEYAVNFVSKELRNQLDELFGNVNRFNMSFGLAYSEVDKEITLAASKFYGVPLAEVRYSASPYPGASVGIPLINQALFGWNPERVWKASFPNVIRVSYFIDIVEKVPQGTSPTRRIEDPDQLTKFEDFFREVSKKTQSKAEIVILKKTLVEITHTALKTREEILKQIKEPWSM